MSERCKDTLDGWRCCLPLGHEEAHWYQNPATNERALNPSMANQQDDGSVSSAPQPPQRPDFEAAGRLFETLKDQPWFIEWLKEMAKK